MEIYQSQQQLPSHIHGNENIHDQALSQMNIHSNIYFDETTVIGRQIGLDSHSDNTDIWDDTVIGGVNEDARNICSQGSHFQF